MMSKKKIMVISSILLMIGFITGFNLIKKDKNYEVAEISVCNGDTLWSIATEHCPNSMDKRDYIAKIMADNNINANIKQGQVIKIREYTE